MKPNLLFSVLFTLLFQTVFSQTVSFDPTFGTGGKIINTSITSGQAIQLQNDGKIVSCYLSNFSISGNVNLARFNTDGSIDTSFGANGFVNTILVSETGGIDIMKIQPDGKILITGYISQTGTANSSYFDFCTARFNSDGTIDTSFGSNGYAITGFQILSSDDSSVIAIQNDGKILVGGFSSQYLIPSSNYSPDLALVRYLSNGTLDTSFGFNGKFTYNFGTSTIPNTSGFSSDYISSIKINSIGKIIIGAQTNVNETLVDYGNFGFICLNSDGTLDPSFGTNGQRIVDFGAKDFLSNLRITTDDKIIATGRHQYTNGAAGDHVKIPLVKLLANGNYDTSFGNNGIVLTNRDAINLEDLSNDLNIQPDGKIICFGVTPNQTGTIGNFLLIRFNVNGAIDTTFNNVGYKALDFNNSSAIGTTFLFQNDGKILCAGSINYSVGCLARLDFDTLSNNTFANKYFSVYPNPFIDSIKIESNEVDFSNATIELYDISGRKLNNFVISNGNGFSLPIDINLSKGNYFLKVTSGLKQETIKIIKE